MRIANVLFIALLLLSAPAHAEWTQQNSGTTADLVDVCFVDELHGWAIGRERAGVTQVIIATEDGGITWQPQVCPVETIQLNKVIFITEQIGFIACQSISNSENFESILHTTDCGETWEVSYNAPSYYKFNDITFIDEQTGWAVGGVHGTVADDEPYGGVVLLTKDGGDTWDEQLHVTTDEINIDAFTAIAFADEQHGWMLGYNAFVSASGIPFNVYYTSNGGDNWNIIRQIDDARGARRLYVVDRDTLWTAQAIHLSVDSGLTWSDLPYAADISLIDGTSGWAVTSFLDSNVGDPEFKIHYFSDAGESWSEQYDHGELWLYAIDSIGENYACAVGENGTILTYGENPSRVDALSQPDLFTLEPSYPNPFNASTTISYTLTSDSPVTINLYNATGQLVQTLCDQYKPAGRHSVVVDGSDLSSGVYFARVYVQGTAQYTRMLMLK